MEPSSSPQLFDPEGWPSMAWIKVREDLRTDPSVFVIASRCSVTARHVVGALVEVWAWAGRLSEDGVVPLGNHATIDEVAGCAGFAAAMEEVGWLSIEPTQAVFPKWDRHNSDDAKARALNAERQRRHRQNEPLESNAAPLLHVTVERDQRRGDKRRVEDSLRSGASAPGALPGMGDIKPPKGRRKPTQNQVDGFVARAIWQRCWLAQFGTAYTDMRGKKSGAMRTAFVRLGRNEGELERTVCAFLAAPPFKSRENPDPVAFLDTLASVIAGLNGKPAKSAAQSEGTLERVRRGQEELKRAWGLSTETS